MEQARQQVERLLRKVASKFPAAAEDSMPMTDIHLRLIQESGELRAYDDDGQELFRCVVEAWIDNKDDGFWTNASNLISSVIADMKDVAENYGVLKPYSFVLEDDESEHMAELYLVDDDMVILGGGLMEGLDSDLDAFFENLMK